MNIKEKIDNVISCLQKTDGLVFDGDRFVVPARHKEVFAAANIQFEEFGSDLRLQLKAYFQPDSIMYGPILNSEITADEIDRDFVAFDLSGGFVYFKAAGIQFETVGTTSPEFVKQVRNTVSYFKFFAYLKSSEFSDYFNAANNEIVIYNSSNGVQRITFETIPNIDSIFVSTEIATRKLLEFAKPLEFRFFFQNAAFILGGNTGVTRLIDIINEYVKVISIAQRDYQIVSKKFDFDKFQDALIKEKVKYFNSIRDVVSKVAGQSVGIPISIGAAVFTSYKVSGDLPLLTLLLITFIIYVVFYWRFQNFYQHDIKEVRRDFNRDFDKIKADSGLPPASVETERKAIVGRLDKTDSMIRWLKITVIGLSVVVTTFMICQMLSLAS